MGRCIDGAFLVAANTELRIDRASGMIVPGQLTVDSAVVVTFYAGGSVTVTVAGMPPATFARTDISAICAL